MSFDEVSNLIDNRAIAEAFYNADDDRKGYLNKYDLRVAMMELHGYRATKYELEKLMQSADVKSVDGVPVGVSLEKFQEFMKSRHKPLANDHDNASIRQAFLALDSRCRNFLTIEDLHRAVSNCAPSLPSHVVEEVFREADLDRDGRVSYTDFELLMKMRVT